ncbi:hypothetical protein [Longimicrobium sp.]|jgi:hypothetical protein|uniref:hypothetical protein n=1 Tax=Longimicrobium sp. TaxID=2029185 RepID=UPI002EDB2801
MAFELRVEFAGPCLFVVHTDSTVTPAVTQEVTVLMPDARASKHPSPPKHLDEDDAQPHIGFLRLDLAQLDRRFPRRTGKDDPKYELVHRFDRQVVEFAGVEAEPIHDLPELAYPDFARIAPKGQKFAVELLDNVLEAAPPPALLMRAKLRGGRFESSPRRKWVIPPILNTNGNEYQGDFGSDICWIRHIDEDCLTIRITDFDGSNIEAEFDLGPFAAGEEVTVVMGNLCCDNPLGWNNIARPDVPDVDDDFKWLYRLLRTKGKSTLEFPGKKLPAPIAVKRQAASDQTSRSTEKLPILTSEEACMGGKITFP